MKRIQLLFLSMVMMTAPCFGMFDGGQPGGAAPQAGGGPEQTWRRYAGEAFTGVASGVWNAVQPRLERGVQWVENKIDENKRKKGAVTAAIESLERAQSGGEASCVIDITVQPGTRGIDYERRETVASAAYSSHITKLKAEKGTLDNNFTEMMAEQLREGANDVREEVKASRQHDRDVNAALIKAQLWFNNVTKMMKDPRILGGTVLTIGAAAFLVYLAKHGTARMFINVPNAIKETSILSPRQRLFNLFTGRKTPPSVRHELHYNEKERREIDHYASTIMRNAQKGRPLPHALFWGPPGTGKTAFAKELARTAGADYIIFSANELLGGTMAQAIQAFSSIIAYGRSSRKKACIVFIDEADSVFGKRRADGSGDIMQRITNMFLENTEKTSDRKLCFIMATNVPQALAAPVGNRLGVKLKFSAPEEDTRMKILGTYLSKFGEEYGVPLHEVLEQDEVLRALSQEAHGLVGRDLESIVQGAYDQADADGDAELAREHVEAALRRKIEGNAKITEDDNLDAYL